MARYDVGMEIFGRIASGHEAATLAEAIASDEAAPGWGEARLVERDEAAGHVLDSARGGRPLRLTRGDTGTEMEATAAACRELDFAYRIRFDDLDGNPVRLVAWAPGFPNVFETETVSTDGVLVRAASVEAAFRKSSEEGFAFLERFRRGDLPGIERAFRIDPHLADELEETLFDEGTAPSP